jgi:hypothetical protein
MQEKASVRMLKYIHLMYAYSSTYRNLSDEERHENAVYDSEIDEKWLENSTVKVAIEKYKGIQETVSIKAVNSFSRLLRTAMTASDMVTSKLDKLMRKPTLTDTELTDLLDTLNSSIITANKLPDLIKKYRELEEAVRAEMGVDSKIRGNEKPGRLV